MNNIKGKTLSIKDEVSIKHMLGEMQDFVMNFECGDAVKSNVLGNTIRIWRLIKQ